MFEDMLGLRFFDEHPEFVVPTMEGEVTVYAALARAFTSLVVWLCNHSAASAPVMRTKV